MNLSLFHNWLIQKFTIILRFFQNWSVKKKCYHKQNSRIAQNSHDENFFDETQNLISLWSQNLTHKIWVKSETNFFSKGGTLWYFFDVPKIIKGSPLWMEKKMFVYDSTQISCGHFELQVEVAITTTKCHTLPSVVKTTIKYNCPVNFQCKM